MEIESLTELTDRICHLVATKATTTDPKVGTSSLEEALRLACEMMMKWNLELNALAARVLNESGFGEEQAVISFRDVVKGNDDLSNFESEQALRGFLGACRWLHIEQSRLPKDVIQEIHRAVVDTWERFMDQNVGLPQMCEQFHRLKRFFCRTPHDGCGGSPVLPRDGPDGGPSPEREITVRRYLRTFTAIGRLIISVIPLYARAEAVPTVRPQTSETRTVALLSLLLLSGFSDMLNENEHIPGEVLTPLVPVPAGGSTEEPMVI